MTTPNAPTEPTQPLPPSAPAEAATPPAPAKSAKPTPAPVQRYARFSLGDRLQHGLAILSFTMLAITGLPQEFANQGWAQSLIGFFGGIENTRSIHHLFAVILMLEVVFHLVSVGYTLYVRRARPAMLPGARDVTDGLGSLAYNLGLRQERPEAGHFSFEEKIEYWAFVWGTVIMVITGFMMWNPIATAKLLPGEFIPAAKTAHGMEALLAVLAVLIWHLYHVHIRHLNLSMFTGSLSEKEMRDEHGLELAELEASQPPAAEKPGALAKRQRLFWPVAGVLSLVLLFGIYEFVTFEDTAPSTVPLRVVSEAQLQPYAPLTPTPLPTAPYTPAPLDLKPVWQGNIGLLLINNCGACHSGSSPLAGLDFSSYASAMKGGQDGPVIVPGDPEHSLIVTKISSNTHSGKLIAAQMVALENWIKAGAPEQ